MGGIVIAFPRVRARCQRRIKSLPRSRSQRPQLKAQIERIMALLGELEDISAHSRKLPPAMRARTRTSIRKAERALGLRDDVAHASSAIPDQASAPQPNVDREVLERLFNFQDQYL
jgi:hypothetical protein